MFLHFTNSTGDDLKVCNCEKTHTNIILNGIQSTISKSETNKYIRDFLKQGGKIKKSGFTDLDTIETISQGANFGAVSFP